MFLIEKNIFAHFRLEKRKKEKEKRKKIECDKKTFVCVCVCVCVCTTAVIPSNFINIYILMDDGGEGEDTHTSVQAPLLSVATLRNT